MTHLYKTCIKEFLAPSFLVCRKQLPRPFLSSKEQIQAVTDERNEGIKKQWKGSLETMVQPWIRVLVPPQRIYKTIWYISLSSSTVTKGPIQVEDGNFRLSARMWTPDWVETGWLVIVIAVTPLCYFIISQSEEGQIYSSPLLKFCL